MNASRPRHPRASPQPAAVLAPLPPLLRDPWLLVVLLAPLLVVWMCRGVPLGTPFADDFDFLAHARFGPGSWLDGGGGAMYWRPLARQAYYGLLGPLLLSHPGVLAALHVAALAMAGALAYAALRPALGRGPAALAAIVPATIEGARSVVAWPSCAQELGAWLFLSVALLGARRRRLPVALLGCAAALLCKETAAAVVPLVALAVREPTRRDRWTWLAAHGALLAAWLAAHRAVESLAQQLPLSAYAPGSSASGAERLAWALARAFEDTLDVALLAGPLRTGAAILVGALIVTGVVRVAMRRAPADDRLRTTAWGLAWFVLAAAPAAALHPDWASYRSLLPSFGLGVALAAALRGAGAPVLAALAMLRVVALLLSPMPPALVTPDRPDAAAALDFARLARLQRFTADTRALLQQAHPELPRGAVVVMGNMPHHILHVFAGNRALHAWYGDSTLRMVSAATFVRLPALPVVASLQFQPDHVPQLVVISGAAQRAQDDGMRALRQGRFDEALATLARADSLAPDPEAVVFRAGNAGGRAFALQLERRTAEAELEARRALALQPSEMNAAFVLAAQAMEAGRFDEASAAIDVILAQMPNSPSALALKQRLDQARAAAGR